MGQTCTSAGGIGGVSLAVNEMILGQQYQAICARYLRESKNPDEIAKRKTKLGANITDLVKSGKNNLKGKIGVYATDEDAFVTFKDLFDFIKQGLEKWYHTVPPTVMRIREIRMKAGIPTDVPAGGDIPRQKYVTSVRVRFARNISTFPFPCFMKLEDRLRLEDTITSSLAKLTGPLEGTYTKMGDLSLAEQADWVKRHLLFENKDTYLSSANFYDDWPKARGCYKTKDETVLVWINEEDHIRVMSLEPQWNIRDVYAKVKTILKHLEDTVGFAYDKNYGFLTSCPTNLGTGMRASVHCNLGNLKKKLKISELKELASTYKLEVRGIAGENTGYEGDIFDISNAERNDVDPDYVIDTVVNGTGELIKLDQLAA